jgi:hypothetical protein
MRRIALVAVALIPFALAACSDVSAPHRDQPCTGYVDAGGLCHEDGK